MNTHSRDFVTVDMRGLKAALVARAQAERLSVSVLVRGAVAHGLGLPEEGGHQQVEAPSGAASSTASVKLSIRMAPEEAKKLAAGARAAGLSRGAYLAGLIANVPVLSAGGDRAEHIATLIASSAELSTLSRNIQRLTALLRQANVAPARPYREMLDTLAGDVRSHLELAARVLADLQPRTRSAGTSAHSTSDHKETTMSQAPNIDGILITWGDRLFYPKNRVVRVKPQPRLSSDAARLRAAVIRKRIEATVVRRAPQVMVKVTGGGRGMKAIAAHLRYISKNGRLDIEDERGETMRGKEALRELADDWRFGGTLIDDIGEPNHRRQAYNIMLSMPRGINPLTVQRAAREYAQAELADHKYVMVLHDHQANPHVHISVRAESKHGKRLNPRKADLHRWRETFAQKLRGQGIEAEATRQATRGRSRNYEPLWRVKARDDGRLRTGSPGKKSSPQARATRAEAVETWMQVGRALAISGDPADRDLARSIAAFVKEMPFEASAIAPATSPRENAISIEPRR